MRLDTVLHERGVYTGMEEKQVTRFEAGSLIWWELVFRRVIHAVLAV